MKKPPLHWQLLAVFVLMQMHKGELDCMGGLMVDEMGLGKVNLVVR